MLFSMLFCTGVEDYTNERITLTFSPSSSMPCANIAVAPDSNVENAEDFSVLLETNDTSVNITLSRASVTIIDMSSEL